MKLSLVLIFSCFIISIHCEEFLEQDKLSKDVRCIEIIQDVLTVALTIDDHIDATIVEALVLKINEDCDNLLDVIAPVVKPSYLRSLDGNVDEEAKILTIVLNRNTQKVISISGTPNGDEQSFGFSQRYDNRLVMIVYAIANLFNDEWLLSGFISEEYVPQDSTDEVESSNSEDDENKVSNSGKEITKGTNKLMMSDPHNILLPLHNAKDIVVDKLGILVKGKSKKDLLEDNRSNGPQRKRRYVSGFMGKPSCNVDEDSYCNFNCTTLTCENLMTEMPNYLGCVTASIVIRPMCFLGKWSKCECRLGLARDTNTGRCIPPEYCASIITTQKSQTLETTTNKPTNARKTTNKGSRVTTTPKPQSKN